MAPHRYVWVKSSHTNFQRFLSNQLSCNNHQKRCTQQSNTSSDDAKHCAQQSAAHCDCLFWHIEMLFLFSLCYYMLRQLIMLSALVTYTVECMITLPLVIMALQISNCLAMSAICTALLYTGQCKWSNDYDYSHFVTIMHNLWTKNTVQKYTLLLFHFQENICNIEPKEYDIDWILINI